MSRDIRSCFLYAGRCASSDVLQATLENWRQSTMLATTLYTGFASSCVAQGHPSDATAGRSIFAGNVWLAEARQTLRQALALPRQNYKPQIILANCCVRYCVGVTWLRTSKQGSTEYAPSSVVCPSQGTITVTKTINVLRTG